MYKQSVSAGGAEPIYLDGDNRAAIERYVLASGLVGSHGLPIAVERAGAGNMNLALRVTPASGRSFIVKQGRPWVEKYPHIPAPFERTLVEAAFYATVQPHVPLAGRMPAALYIDSRNHVLVLEDVGGGGDFTSIYTDGAMPAATVGQLLEWLEQLAFVDVPAERRAIFANRPMRVLNHEHMFDLPLRDANGLDLDGITPGLRDAARELIRDRVYSDAVTAVGSRYLSDGGTLVHGDYFPGSWLKACDGVRIIDPEFCFLGDREFDYGILAAHLIIGQCDPLTLTMALDAAERGGLDVGLVTAYAGVEIMRRLIGVAQLPLTCDIDRKRALLERSRRLVIEPRKGLA